MRPLLSLLFALCVLVVAPSASAQVVVTGGPVAPLPEQPGTGLCLASSNWLGPASDLPQSQSNYVGNINAFMEGSRARWITSVLGTDADLSNNFNDGRTLSQGDFTGACGAGGCAFAYSGGSTIFATRLRGYLAITQAQVGKSLHFGLYADDAVSLTLYDRAAQSYTVVVRPPTLGAPTWRMTNTVVFKQAGLYGVEVLHTQISEHAALELSLFEGTFTDFAQPANQPPVVNLRTEGFELMPLGQFHQAESGGLHSRMFRSASSAPGRMPTRPGTAAVGRATAAMPPRCVLPVIRRRPAGTPVCLAV
ncbi:outer membrane exchange protein TraA family protein [Corallococcus sp. CA047B]|uniref:outer membrane exchange protein TraA family protein n=1 Tax=Corallococcus sp. CA047B TaxID=2316729 RepID=UPI001F23C2A5|nr:outer membrane exchange protein TraA family protein [Corallococcus sp. CA047B]